MPKKVSGKRLGIPEAKPEVPDWAGTEGGAVGAVGAAGWGMGAGVVLGPATVALPLVTPGSGVGFGGGDCTSLGASETIAGTSLT